MKDLICMIFCGVALFFLASSDALINMSSSSVLGSTDDSQLSFKAVAVGITVALLACGSIAHALDNKMAIAGVWFCVALATCFSAVLTIQSASIDYLANDKSNRIQNAVRNNNERSIKDLKDEKREIQKLIDECKKDQHFASCALSYRRLEQISTEITKLRRDNSASIRSEEIDITDAVELKAGIDGATLERIGIYSRAIGVPVLISLCMFGFWTFQSRYVKTMATA
jgi:hypothetical protein